MSFYLRIGERVEGPFTTGEVQSRLERQVVTLQTPAWQVGWPAWQTVAEALQPAAPSGVPPSGPATPPPLPVAAAVAFVATEPPGYTRTLLLAGALFVIDGVIGGGGYFSIVTLVIGLPGLVIRALVAWKDSALLRRRFASVGIYAVAALATIALVRSDQAGARTRAEQVIAACEAFKAVNGDYPKELVELTPKFLPAIPPARQVGRTKRFTYDIGGPNNFVKGTNVHTLIYTSSPPIGRSYYVFEEKRWGFYD